MSKKQQKQAAPSTADAFTAVKEGFRGEDVTNQTAPIPADDTTEQSTDQGQATASAPATPGGDLTAILAALPEAQRAAVLAAVTPQQSTGYPGSITVTVTDTATGRVLGQDVCAPRLFKSGKDGFYGQIKFLVPGLQAGKFTGGLNLVRAHSERPEAVAERPAGLRGQ